MSDDTSAGRPGALSPGEALRNIEDLMAAMLHARNARESLETLGPLEVPGSEEAGEALDALLESLRGILSETELWSEFASVHSSAVGQFLGRAAAEVVLAGMRLGALQAGHTGAEVVRTEAEALFLELPDLYRQEEPEPLTLEGLHEILKKIASMASAAGLDLGDIAQGIETQ